MSGAVITNTPPNHGTGPRPAPAQKIRSRSSARSSVLRRLALAPFIFLGASLLVFVMIDLSPNDPAFAQLGIRASPEDRARFAEQHGLDDPLAIRYWRFLVDISHLNFGDSLFRSESVSQLVASALPVTAQLLALSALIAVVLSLMLGTLAAWREGRMTDRILSTAVAVLQASPSFWVGVLFVQLFAVTLGLLPAGGYSPMAQGFSSWLTSIIGPAIVLSLGFTAGLTRVVRASMSDELSKDYTLTAVGVGVPWTVVLARNVMRNALIAPITVLGVYIGALMSGAIIVEIVFNVPGMGTLLINGVTQGDLAVVRGVVIVGAAAFIVVNLIVDLLYLVLNPHSSEASAQ